MSVEEMVNILKENDVDFETEGTSFEVCFEDTSDPGPYGGYPNFSYYDSFKEAAEAAISIIEGGEDVYSISAC